MTFFKALKAQQAPLPFSTCSSCSAQYFTHYFEYTQPITFTKGCAFFREKFRSEKLLIISASADNKLLVNFSNRRVN